MSGGTTGILIDLVLYTGMPVRRLLTQPGSRMAADLYAVKVSRPAVAIVGRPATFLRKKNNTTSLRRLIITGKNKDSKRVFDSRLHCLAKCVMLVSLRNTRSIVKG